MKNDRLRSLVLILRVGGLWLDFSELGPAGLLLTAVQLLRFAFLAYGWLALVDMMMVKGVSFIMEPASTYIPFALNVFISTAFFLVKMKKIEELIAECDKNLESYVEPWEQEVIREDTVRVEYFSRSFKFAIGAFDLSYITFPQVVNLVRALNGNPEGYTVPILFGGYLDGDHPIRDWDFYKYTYLSYLWILLATINTFSYQCCLFFIVSVSTTEMRIIKKHLKMLAPDDGTRQWDLGHIVLKHSRLLRVNALQNQSIALPAIVTCRIIYTFKICFVMMTTQQSYSKGDNAVAILAGSFIVILLLTSLVLCSAGEYLEQQSEQLHEAVRGLPWYMQGVKSRRNYLMLQRQTSKTIVFDYAYIITLNLRCYLLIVNNSFSYLLMINSLQQQLVKVD